VRILAGAITLVVVLGSISLSVLYAAGGGEFGTAVVAGEPTGHALPPAVIEERNARQAETAADLELFEPKQILFGDLHVHSSFSTDAFQLSLPTAGGEGVHPVADACDFARFCANLDFWSINDHANSITARRWQETVDTVRQCNQISRGSAGGVGDRDLVSFLGWEWTQMGSTPDNHYGHKNVILRDLAEDAIPARPIAAAPRPACPRHSIPGRPAASNSDSAPLCSNAAMT